MGYDYCYRCLYRLLLSWAMERLPTLNVVSKSTFDHAKAILENHRVTFSEPQHVMLVRGTHGPSSRAQ